MSTVNAAGNYTKPKMRKSLFQAIKNRATHGTKLLVSGQRVRLSCLQRNTRNVVVVTNDL